MPDTPGLRRESSCCTETTLEVQDWSHAFGRPPIAAQALERNRLPPTLLELLFSSSRTHQSSGGISLRQTDVQTSGAKRRRQTARSMGGSCAKITGC
jgi:hypothetical protein